MQNFTLLSSLQILTRTSTYAIQKDSPPRFPLACTHMYITHYAASFFNNPVHRSHKHLIQSLHCFFLQQPCSCITQTPHTIITLLLSSTTLFMYHTNTPYNHYTASFFNNLVHVSHKHPIQSLHCFFLQQPCSPCSCITQTPHTIITLLLSSTTLFMYHTNTPYNHYTASFFNNLVHVSHKHPIQSLHCFFLQQPCSCITQTPHTIITLLLSSTTLFMYHTNTPYNHYTASFFNNLVHVHTTPYNHYTASFFNNPVHRSHKHAIQSLHCFFLQQPCSCITQTPHTIITLLLSSTTLFKDHTNTSYNHYVFH